MQKWPFCYCETFRPAPASGRSASCGAGGVGMNLADSQDPLLRTHSATQDNVQEGKGQEDWVTGTGKLRLGAEVPPKCTSLQSHFKTVWIRDQMSWVKFSALLNSSVTQPRTAALRSLICCMGARPLWPLPAVQTGSLRNAGGFLKRRIISEATLVIRLSQE